MHNAYDPANATHRRHRRRPRVLLMAAAAILLVAAPAAAALPLEDDDRPHRHEQKPFLCNHSTCNRLEACAVDLITGHRYC